MYKYYSLLRPISMGTIPPCTVSEVENFDQRKYVDEIGREAWGYFVTPDEISEKKQGEFDLASKDTIVSRWRSVAEKISQFSRKAGDELDTEDILSAVTSGNLEDVTGYLVGYSKTELKSEALVLFKEVNSLRRFS